MTAIQKDKKNVGNPAGIREITVIGEGKMGSNIFGFLSNYPYALNWICSKDADIEKIRQNWEKRIARGQRTGLFSEKEAGRRRSFVITNLAETASNSDLILEAIPENREEKISLFNIMDLLAPPNCIFASNSSSILPSDLIASEARAGTTLGIHFFYPVNLKNTVELVVTGRTRQTVINDTEQFLSSIGKTTLLQNNFTAFALNRVYLDFQAEAFSIVEEGTCSITGMDNLVREHLFPLAPFECIDSVGLDIMIPSVTNYAEMSPDGERYIPLLEAMSVRRIRGKGFSAEFPQEINPVINEAGILVRLKMALKASLLKFSGEDVSAGLFEAFREYVGNENLVV